MPSVLPGRDEKEVGMTLNGMLIGSDDVHGQFERLKAAGPGSSRSPTSPMRTLRGWITTFSDPDDNYFHLVSPFPG